MTHSPKTLIVLASLALAASGCSDPAEGKPMAEVQEKAAAPAPAGAPAPAAGKTTAALPAAPAGALPFSAPESKVGFVGAKVTGKHEGGFERFQGWLALEGNMPRGVAVSIDMTSTWSDAEKLTKHLKSKDFFDVEQFPTATFVSTAFEEGGDGGATHIVTGDLTLHGVTKTIKFPVQAALTPEKAAVTAEFGINRKDFNIVYPGKPDDLIEDNVLIKLAVVATRGAAQ